MAVYEVANASLNSGHITLSEQHIYGSIRLGIRNPKLDINDGLVIPKISIVNTTTKGFLSNFERGNKFFELSNHLGNVLATVSDKKMGVDADNNGTIDYYNADVVSAQDYAPFGMQLVGRKYNSGGYRYGFNGKENDNDVKGEGNQQDYGMRIYDPRLGKFLSVDPLTDDYAELTPYQFASNTPISGIDKDGLEYEDSKSVWDVIMDVLFSTDKYKDGAKTFSDGATQSALVESGQADYQQQPGISPFQKRWMDLQNKWEGRGKMIKGATDMYEATAEASANTIPLEEFFAKGFKALSKGIPALKKINLKVTEKFVQKTPVFSPTTQKAIAEYLQGLCFSAGTGVLTKTGLVNIENIRVGDSVWAFNELTQTRSLQRVYKLIKNQTTEFVCIHINKYVVLTTSIHPFWLNSSWVEARFLRKGDSLSLFNGLKYSIDSVGVKDTIANAYNFAVENLHTYYVSPLNILVHNSNPCITQVKKWTNYNFKHIASNKKSWAEVIKSTKSGVAKYIQGIDVQALETKVLNEGIEVKGGNWKVMKHEKIIGAKDGVETMYSRVEITPDGTYHGHPITEQEYKKLIKNK